MTYTLCYSYGVNVPAQQPGRAIRREPVMRIEKFESFAAALDRQQTVAGAYELFYAFVTDERGEVVHSEQAVRHGPAIDLPRPPADFHRS